ncbi:unnamed protein product [Cuscuta epithymum]|uniref:Uncharacterized protein n=1 Tax=Cuscuta epithymum TaxID=186058 RepID=A0AAV0DMF4_9ASTE|nr:unnamed protein product [Cuscuta epithymum]CAH9139938.1 unnamed protein product [Cuscuta epithymum]
MPRHATFACLTGILRISAQSSERDAPHMRYDPFSNSNMSTEDMVRAIATNMTTIQNNMVQFQNETKSSISNLETQMIQIARVVSRLEARDSEKLPSQIECDPKQQTFAITLTNEKEMQKEIQNPEEVEEERDAELQLIKEEDEPSFKVKYLSLSSFEVPPTILKTLRETHKIDKDNDIFEIFSKIEGSKHFPLTMFNDNFFPSLPPHESMKIWIFDPGKIFKVKSQEIKHSYGSPRSESVKKINYHDPSLND